MKRRILVLFLILSPLAFLQAQSLWEGTTAMGRYGEFPTTGLYGACNAFPRNTIVTVQNVTNGKTVEVIIVNRLQDAGLFMLLSREAATALGIEEGAIVKTRVVLSEKKRTGLVSSGDDQVENPDPDVNPHVGIAEELAFLDEILGTVERTVTPPVVSDGEQPLISPIIGGEQAEEEPEVAEEAVAEETPLAEESAPEAVITETPKEPDKDILPPKEEEKEIPEPEPEELVMEIPDLPVVEEAPMIGSIVPEQLSVVEPLPMPEPRVAEQVAEAPVEEAPVEETAPLLPVVVEEPVVEEEDIPLVTEQYLPVEPEETARPEMVLAEPLIGAAAEEPPLIIAESSSLPEEEPIPLMEYTEPEPIGEAIAEGEPFIVESAVVMEELPEEEVAVANEPEFIWPEEEVPVVEPESAPEPEVALVPEPVMEEEPEIPVEASEPEVAPEAEPEPAPVIIAEAVPEPEPDETKVAITEVPEEPKEEIPVAEETTFIFEPAGERPPEPVSEPEPVAEPEPVVVAIVPETVSEVTIPAVSAAIPKLQIQRDAIYLQIGVFSEASSALRVAAALQATYPIGVLEQKVSGRTTYRVIVGPLSRDEGGATLLSLRSMGYRDAFLRQGTSLE